MPSKIEGTVEITPAAGEAELAAPSAPPTAPAEITEGVYRLGGSVSPPSLIHKVEPSYTEEARQALIEGTVILVAEVGSDGKARNFRIVQSLDPGLDQKAIEAVAKWTFQPGKRDGTPVTVLATFEVNFRLRR